MPGKVKRDSIAEAQRVLDEIVFTGISKLSNGRELVPDNDQLIAVLKWAASRGKRAIHSVPVIDDFQPGEEDGP